MNQNEEIATPADTLVEMQQALDAFGGSWRAGHDPDGYRVAFVTAETERTVTCVADSLDEAAQKCLRVLAKHTAPNGELDL